MHHTLRQRRTLIARHSYPLQRLNARLAFLLPLSVLILLLVGG